MLNDQVPVINISTQQNTGMLFPNVEHFIMHYKIAGRTVLRGRGGPDNLTMSDAD